MPVVSRLVMDPSVVIKWYVPEDKTEVASELKEWILSGTHRMIVPPLFFDEITNILWKKEILRKETLPRTSLEILWEVLRLPMNVYQDQHEMLPKALEIARKTRATVYDAVYVTTAIQNQAVFITADDRLAQRLAASAYASSAVSLDEWKKITT